MRTAIGMILPRTIALLNRTDSGSNAYANNTVNPPVSSPLHKL